jgi:glutamate-1-semialdehyde 2,1-aminomutase
MLTVFFRPGPVHSWNDAKQSDTAAFGRWHRALLEQGVYWPPAQYEAAFISLAHTEALIDQTIQAMSNAFARRE